MPATTADVILPLERSEDESAQRRAVARRLGVAPARVRELRLLKHSIDARKPAIKVRLRFEVGLDEPLPSAPEPAADYPAVPPGAPTALIVGCGPAGLFAALRCLELGWRPVILERGKDASARRFDLAPILRKGQVDEESNYCFGEGGAGTYSDGKLYTRATKRGSVRSVYETLVAHGAPERILVDAHPHIGSNLLPRVVMALRESVTAAGGEVRFQNRVDDFLVEKGRAAGVFLQDGEELRGDALILATGHSARDIYRLLHRRGLRLEAKAFAVGVRIEHPQPLIDSLQYHFPREQERPRLLPAAPYRLATEVGGRGVHSFCMCPGGFIVPASTANDEIVVNGMSLSKRDSPFANSGLVVSVQPEDLRELSEKHGVLAGLAFQETLEHRAKESGGGGQVAPAQRAADFLAGRDSKDLGPTSYHPGLVPARLDQLLPDWIAGRMGKGLRQFGRRMPGYLGDEAQLVGFETRTSSPVRIPRDQESLQHPDLPGLFPCGEGAGYAGGIVSAALDGIRCAEALTAGKRG